RSRRWCRSRRRRAVSRTSGGAVWVPRSGAGVEVVGAADGAGSGLADPFSPKRRPISIRRAWKRASNSRAADRCSAGSHSSAPSGTLSGAGSRGLAEHVEADETDGFLDLHGLEVAPEAHDLGFVGRGDVLVPLAVVLVLDRVLLGADALHS